MTPFFFKFYMFVKLSTLLTLGNNTLLFVFRFAAYYLNWTLFWWYKIERKSINALRACVYIYIRQLSLFRGLSIWLSLLAIFQYTFLSLFQEKTDNTLKEVFSINALCAPNDHFRKIITAQNWSNKTFSTIQCYLVEVRFTVLKLVALGNQQQDHLHKGTKSWPLSVVSSERFGQHSQTEHRQIHLP